MAMRIVRRRAKFSALVAQTDQSSSAGVEDGILPEAVESRDVVYDGPDVSVAF